MKFLQFILPACSLFFAHASSAQTHHWTETHHPFGGPVGEVIPDSVGRLFVFQGGNGDVSLSNDSGKSWHLFNDGLNLPAIDAFAVGRHSEIYEVRGGKLMASHNGVSWTEFDRTGLSASTIVKGIEVAPTGDRYIASDQGALYFRAESALAWSLMVGAKAGAFQIDATGTLVMSMGDSLRRSGDQGVTWQTVAIPPIISSVSGFWVFSPHTWLLATNLEGDFISFDEGASWKEMNGAGEPLQVTGATQVIKNGRAEFYLVNSGDVVSSPDTGRTWNTTHFQKQVIPQQIYSSSSGKFFIVARNGLYSSIDAVTWEKSDSGYTSLPVFNVLALDNSHWLASADYLYRSSNAGASWSPIYKAALAMVQLDGDTVLTVDVDTVGVARRSTDAGATWTDFGTGFKHSRSAAISSDGRGNVYVSGDSTEASTDAGKTWHQIRIGPNKLTAQQLRPLHDESVIAGTTEGVYTSVDYGQTWNLSNLQVPLDNISTGADGYVAALGPRDTLFVSTDGGNQWSRKAPITRGQYYFLLELANGGLLAGGSSGSLIYSNDTGSTWSEDTAGMREKSFYCAAESPDGTIILGGQDYGIFLGKPAQSVSSFQKQELGALRVYPNPATSNLSISSSGSGPHDVSVVDILGRIVYVARTTNAMIDVSINISTLSKGVYIVSNRDERGRVERGSFVKE